MAKDNKHATDELSTRGTAMKIDGVEELDDDTLEAVVGGQNFDMSYVFTTQYGDGYNLTYDGTTYRVVLSRTEANHLRNIQDFASAYEYCKTAADYGIWTVGTDGSLTKKYLYGKEY